MPRAHKCQSEDCPCVQCSVCSKKYLHKNKLVQHQRHTDCWLQLTPEQREADQAGGKVGQVAEVVKSEEEVKVVVREPIEEEEQLGLDEEEMVAERSEVGEQGGEQEEMVEVEVVMGRQGEEEETVVIEVEEEVEEVVEEERPSENQEHWGLEEVVVVPLTKPLGVEEQLEVEEQEEVVLGEPSEEELGGEEEGQGEVEVVAGEQQSPSTGKPQSKSIDISASIFVCIDLF